MSVFKKCFGVLLLASIAYFPWVAQAVPTPTQVDLELVLAVDVSSSVSSSEYAGQKNGYIAAFNDAAIQTAITSGKYGSIAVTYVEWSSSSRQEQLVDWTLIDSAASASAFASAINGTSRAFGGSTGVGSAIQYSAGLFSFNDPDNAKYLGDRKVIDISGDGTNNTGISPSTARDNALAAGVTTINAIAIETASLEDYFKNNVIGGPNAFATFAADFEDDFSQAIKDKIFREITEQPVPEPATFGLLGLGLAGLAFARRRKQVA